MFNLSRPMAPELEDFYFHSDDRALVDGCVTALTREGLNVAILAPHSAALEHYGHMLMARLRQFTPTSKIEVYFPTSADDVLARFNQALANQSLAQAMQGRKNILATQFWVLNNAAAVPEHELQLLASLVHNFPGANIRLILFYDTSRQAQPSLSAFGKNITRWDIELPSAEQRAQLIAQAQGAAQQKAVRAFMDRLHASDSQPQPQPLVKKRFSSPFAKRKPSMAQQVSTAKSTPWLNALKWTVAALTLLAVSTGIVYRLNPEAFQYLYASISRVQEDITTELASDKAGSHSAQGKTTDSKKVSKTSDDKAADPGKADAPKPQALARPASDLVDELPNEAAAGQGWAKKLPADSYVVQHLALPVFKNVVAWQQANPKLAEAHIVATYKPGDKLAQFVLVSGPFKSRSAAIEFTQNPQTPRFAFAVPAPQLMAQLSPSAAPASLKPKEPRSDR